MKPNDIFLGVVELFSIFIPGLIVFYLLNLTFPVLITDEIDTTSEYIIFAIASYIIGHILFAIGAAWDELYDYIKDNHNQPTDEEITGLKKLRYFYTPGNLQPMIDEAKEIRKKLCTARHDSSQINMYQWSRSIVSQLHEAGFHEILRKEADSKLFRSLLIPIFLLGFILLCQTNYLISGIIFLFALLAYLRYSKQRYKGCKFAYTHLFTLHQLGKLQANKQ